jgi:hypothetical protein
MQTFRPCAGKKVCIENNTHCLACGRKLDIIARTRKLVDELVELALEEEYSNVDEFMYYVSMRVEKKISKHREDNTVADAAREA